MPTPDLHYHQRHPDSTRRRVRDAAPVVITAARHFAPFPRLHAYRLELPGGELHSSDTSRAARSLVAARFPSGPAAWKVERGESGGLHVHVTSPLPPVAVHDHQHAAPVWSLPGWLAYLAKPADSRLCRPGRLSPWSSDSATRARNYRAALEEYGTARRAALSQGRRRLSPLSGWVGTRRVRRHQPSPVLVLAALRFLLAGLLTVPPCGPLPAPHPRRCRPLPGVPERPWRYSLPPPRTQVQAR
jgi:hypothetical protein